jgi:hypothetical protein
MGGARQGQCRRNGKSVGERDLSAIVAELATRYNALATETTHTGLALP